MEVVSTEELPWAFLGPVLAGVAGVVPAGGNVGMLGMIQ